MAKRGAFLYSGLEKGTFQKIIGKMREKGYILTQPGLEMGIIFTSTPTRTGSSLILKTIFSHVYPVWNQVTPPPSPRGY
jgi:hypothetical protein